MVRRTVSITRGGEITEAERQQQAKREVLERSKDDLLFFGNVLSPTAFYTDSPEFHKEMIESIMDRNIIQLMFQAPRGFGKSTLLTFFIMHHIFDVLFRILYSGITIGGRYPIF